MPFAVPWKDLGMITLCQVTETRKDEYDMAYVWNVKKLYKKKSHLQNRNRVRDVENNSWLSQGTWGGGEG